jgi:signal transduction histidine kinase
MEFASGNPRAASPVQWLTGQSVTELLEDNDGRIWIGAREGLWRLSAPPDRKLERLQSGLVSAIGKDSRGRVWVASENAKIDVYTKSGPVQLRFTGMPSPAVYIITPEGKPEGKDDARAGIWFGTARGLARASMHDIEEFIAGRSTVIDAVAYGLSEGMRTIECRDGAQPSSSRLPDGSVWLPTAKGFIEISPASTQALHPPRPWIEQVQVDGKSRAQDALIRLSPGTHELAVHFTAIRLGRGERVQFRYRLQGLDHDWVEAGSERIVRYTHLRPGQFQLQVCARDPEGPWSEAASSTVIEQSPFMYQTMWFRVLVVAAFAGLLVALYRFRLHAVRRQYAAVLEERNRIAREWHDTLLAGLSAASWQLDVAAEACSQSSASKSVENALGMVRYCREEARRAVGDLRNEQVEEISLGDSLRQSVQQLTSGTSVVSRVEIEGKPPAGKNELNFELLRICQEATANALQHARATELIVRLDCSDGCLSLTVQDDGIGMHANTIEHPPDGHYGLLGMRERAQRFGGKLVLSSKPGEGTLVKAVVPFDS